MDPRRPQRRAGVFGVETQLPAGVGGRAGGSFRLSERKRESDCERLRSRQGHFAGEQILSSQLADLEEPENAVVLEVASSPQQIVAEIRQKLGLA